MHLKYSKTSWVINTKIPVWFQESIAGHTECHLHRQGRIQDFWRGGHAVMEISLTGRSVATRPRTARGRTGVGAGGGRPVPLGGSGVLSPIFLKCDLYRCSFLAYLVDTTIISQLSTKKMEQLTPCCQGGAVVGCHPPGEKGAAATSCIRHWNFEEGSVRVPKSSVLGNHIQTKMACLS